jgi:alkaline phosphatase D
MQFLSSGNIGNVVSLSGGNNAFFAGVVQDDYDTTQQPVMVDLATAGISSTSLNNRYVQLLNVDAETLPFVGPLLSAGGFHSLDATLTTYNPWLAYTNTDAQGYAVVTLTPGQLSCTFKKMQTMAGNTVPATASAVASTQQVTVTAGTPAITVVPA